MRRWESPGWPFVVVIDDWKHRKKSHHTKTETTMWNSEIYLKAHCSVQEIKPKIYFHRQEAVYKSYKMQNAIPYKINRHIKKKKTLLWFACMFSKLFLYANSEQ